MVNNTNIKVSVWMITYNHENFIAQAIDSILMQKVNFEYEIVIGEDCSTDKTKSILLDYQKKYPEKINLILHKKNIGIAKNMVETYKACSGTYIAMLEGDDYWIDKTKLETQINFLDNNPDYVLCYQKVNRVDATGKILATSNPKDKPSSDIADILSRGWFMNTGTLVFRNFLIQKFPDFFFRYGSTDYILHVLLAQHGKIGFINSVSSAYRIHQGGITRDFQKNIIPFLNKKLLLLEEIDLYLNRNYSKYIRILKKDIHSQLFIHKLNTKKIKNIISGLKNFIKGHKRKIYNKFAVHLKKQTLI